MGAIIENSQSISDPEPALPTRLEGVGALERLLSEPTAGVIEAIRRLEGDFALLGAGGKIGPSLARMVKRASDIVGVPRRVIGVSRFANQATLAQLEAVGIESIRCDLTNEQQVATLPDVANVIYLAGMKFGANQEEARTWAMNAWVPGVICRKFHRSRIVAFSTGNVYGLTPVARGGSQESDVPAPVGEYAMSCLGRERILEYFSRTSGIPVAVIRLNYACDLRYGVLVDLAERVWHGAPIDLTMGYLNTIWQGDANAIVLQAFRHVASPPMVLNVTGPELLRVRDVCQQLGQLMGRTPKFVGAEAATALLSNASRAFELFGRPRVDVRRLLAWVADWVMRDNPTSGKPTHYESRDGIF